jgi:hypothetical protein
MLERSRYDEKAPKQSMQAPKNCNEHSQRGKKKKTKKKKKKKKNKKNKTATAKPESHLNSV